MNNDLKERARAETVKAFNANLKRHGQRLRGVLRDECEQAAHERVQTALADYDPKLGELSTFVRDRVDGAIKNELTRQDAGSIGTPFGANYAPVSLDTPSAPRFTSDDPSAARWHPVAGIGDPTDDDPESPCAPIYDANALTAPGAAFDEIALTPAAHVAETGKAADRAQAPAAMRQMRREHARLDWELAVSAALASEDVSPDHKETLRKLSAETEAADAYAQAVREVRPHYRPDDDALALAAVFHLLGVLAKLKPLRVEHAPLRAAQTSEAARAIATAWFAYAGIKPRQGPARAFCRDLDALLRQMTPELAARSARAFPWALAAVARLGEQSGAPVTEPVTVRCLWRSDR